MVESLLDLALPAPCPGCGRSAGLVPLCGACRAELATLRAYRTAPVPAPPGFPVCWAMGPYEGLLRQCLLAYKERGCHRLSRPLGGLLAAGVRAAAGANPVLLLPVPATAAAIRSRYGDHVVRMARHAAVVLRDAGQPAAVAPVLRARPRPDSVGLDAATRYRVAVAGFAPRSRGIERLRGAAGAGARIVMVDDIVTTGATLAAITVLLDSCRLPVCHAVVVGATRRRGGLA